SAYSSTTEAAAREPGRCRRTWPWAAASRAMPRAALPGARATALRPAWPAAGLSPGCGPAGPLDRPAVSAGELLPRRVELFGVNGGRRPVAKADARPVPGQLLLEAEHRVAGVVQ